MWGGGEQIKRRVFPRQEMLQKKKKKKQMKELLREEKCILP